MWGKREVVSPILLEEKQSSQGAWQNPGKDVNMCQMGVYESCSSWKDLFWCDLAFQAHAEASVLAMGVALTAATGQPLPT